MPRADDRYQVYAYWSKGGPGRIAQYYATPDRLDHAIEYAMMYTDAHRDYYNMRYGRMLYVQVVLKSDGRRIVLKTFQADDVKNPILMVHGKR